MSSYENYKALDFKNLWHPFTQTNLWTTEDPLIVERAEKFELIDVNGRRYLDGISSLWCNVHGHGEPELISALIKQAEKVCHSTLLGQSHTAILELSEKLKTFLPGNLSRLFFADSGSNAVEAALRIAIEYWQKQGAPAATKKTKFVSLESSYHGDTLGAVSVGYSAPFHAALVKALVPAFQISPPHVFRFYQGTSEDEALTRSIAGLKNLFDQHADEIAAFIFEPLVQGAAGIWTQPVEFLREVAALCRAYDVLLIADEVAVGFGKTGKMFAVEHANLQPDLMVIGKGLSAGYLPISAVAATEKIFQGFSGAPEEMKTFFYGQTFCGNPLAAAVSSANLELFKTRDVLTGVASKAKILERLLKEKIEPLAHVDEVRQCGMMIGIELTSSPGKREAYALKAQAAHKVITEARRNGVVIRPLGNVIVLMPALAMPEVDLERLVSVAAESIQAVLGE